MKYYRSSHTGKNRRHAKTHLDLVTLKYVMTWYMNDLRKNNVDPSILRMLWEATEKLKRRFGLDELEQQEIERKRAEGALRKAETGFPERIWKRLQHAKRTGGA